VKRRRVFTNAATALTSPSQAMDSVHEHTHGIRIDFLFDHIHFLLISTRIPRYRQFQIE
jgi:hypothetical protein